MKNLFFFLMVFSILCVALYLLYRQGIVVTKSIAAVLFLFRPGTGKDSATLDCCSGWVQHVGRFRESRLYEFILDAQLSKGDVEVILLNGEKKQLVKLDQKCPIQRIDLTKNGKYYLRWNFRSTTGNCELHWQ